MSVDKEHLKKLYLSLDQKMRADFSRSLPLSEYIFDRFDRAKTLQAGDQSSVHHYCYIYGDVKIGKDTWVGPMTVLDGSGGLIIGDNCSISAGVHIYSHDSVKKRLAAGVDQVFAIQKSAVQIGSHSYIGPHSVISRGVSLGQFCVVGTNSFVTKSFPDRSVIFGTPAKLQGTVCWSKDGEPYIEWMSSKDSSLSIADTSEKVYLLEQQIRKLEQRISQLEKI